MKVCAHGTYCSIALWVWCFVSSCQIALAGDWTHWRGPEQNGISRDRGLIDDWSLDGKNVLWTSPIGGRATPIVLNGRVYLNCRTSDDASDPDERIHVREQVVCRDAETGRVLWRDQFNVFQTDISAERVGWASMAGDAETGNVYMHSVSGLFRCYSGEGKLLWEHSLLEEYGKISGFGGRTQTPIVDEDRVIISFLAINWGGDITETHGVWRVDGIEARFCGLLVHDGFLYVMADNGVLYAFDALTGTPLWKFDLNPKDAKWILDGRGTRNNIIATPVFVDESVVLGVGQDPDHGDGVGHLYRIDATKTGDVSPTLVVDGQGSTLR